MSEAATTTIGSEAMELMELLRERFGEDFSIGAVAIVVDVIADGPDGPINPILYTCSDPRRWVQAALLGEALASAEDSNEDRITEAQDASGEEPAAD